MSEIVKRMPEYNGKAAYGGALRFLNQLDMVWISCWEEAGDRLPELRFFASDAFGLLYGLDEFGSVSIFWTEDGTVERLGIDEEEFYRQIELDPEATINCNLYDNAAARFGRPNIDQNFALIVELSVGGAMVVENLEIIDRSIHMRQLGAFASRIRGIPIGSKLIPEMGR